MCHQQALALAATYAFTSIGSKPHTTTRHFSGILNLLLALVGCLFAQLLAKILNLAEAIVHELFDLDLSEVICFKQSPHIGIDVHLDFLGELQEHIFVIPVGGCPTEKTSFPVVQHAL